MIEVDDRLVGRAVEDFQVADHRVAHGTGRVDRGVQQVVQHAPAIRLVVGQLAAHDLQLAVELGGLEADVLHGVGHQLDGGQDVLRRAVDVERGHLVGGVGVGGAAEGVDDPLDLLLAAPLGAAAADDVFQHVAQARAQVAALEGAAGVLHVAADRGHRRHVVLLDDDRQAVVQRGQGDVVPQGADAGIAWRGRLRRRRRRGFLFRRSRQEGKQEEKGDAADAENITHGNS